jgi:hypothetical protein
MSSSYVYSQPSTAYQQTPYFYDTPRPHTPFLPPSPSLTASPNPSHQLPVTPVPFPSTTYDSRYPAWKDSTRERRPSWHAQQSPTLLQPPIGDTYNRRHSFTNHAYQQQPPTTSPWSTPSLFINPWIDASAPRQDFFFDLVPTSFSPLRLYAHGQATILPNDEMQQPATHPPITRLRIVSDLIPQWPIDLEFRPNITTTTISPTPYSPYSPNQSAFQQQPPATPPITLADVLIAVYQSMHLRIGHTDWARLNRRDEKAITKSYLRRCGASELEKSHGVKRVDFLKGRTRMLGLVREGTEDGWELFTLVLTDV